MTKPISPAQRRALREIKAWGELGPDAEDNIGCSGAALYAVLDAIERKGLIAQEPGPLTSYRLTDAGNAALTQGGGRG